MSPIRWMSNSIPSPESSGRSVKYTDSSVRSSAKVSKAYQDIFDEMVATLKPQLKFPWDKGPGGNRNGTTLAGTAGESGQAHKAGAESDQGAAPTCAGSTGSADGRKPSPRRCSRKSEPQSLMPAGK